jgi:4-hydroxy-2-oxoheptanedioate aldolase
MSDDAMHESVAAIAACGISPIVRIPEGQHWMVKRALDAGAHGIIVPLLESVEDAKNVVKYAKFPPTGNRGLGSGLSMEKFISGKTGEVQEVSMGDYFRDSNSSTLVCVQIETAGALKQVNEIAAVEGVDVLLIGPTDLGNNIGSYNRNDKASPISSRHTNRVHFRSGHPAVLSGGKHAPELDDAIAKINKAAHDAGKKSAIYFGTGEAGKQYADMGFDMINVANDIAILKTYFAQHAAIAAGK